MLTAKMIEKAAPSQGVTIDFTGTWTNQLGSTMVLNMAGQHLSGRYRSQVSSVGTSADGELVGFVDGDLISFVVNWDAPASLTAWSGQLVLKGGRQTIETLWYLVQNVADQDEPSGLWKSTFAGADEFWRV